VIEAAIAVAELIAEPTPESKYSVQPEGVQEVVADKGYQQQRSRAEPDRALGTGSAGRREGCGLRQPAADSRQLPQDSGLSTQFDDFACHESCGQNFQDLVGNSLS
jgi:hypothetical protein